MPPSTCPHPISFLRGWSHPFPRGAPYSQVWPILLWLAQAGACDPKGCNESQPWDFGWNYWETAPAFPVACELGAAGDTGENCMRVKSSQGEAVQRDSRKTEVIVWAPGSIHLDPTISSIFAFSLHWFVSPKQFYYYKILREIWASQSNKLRNYNIPCPHFGYLQDKSSQLKMIKNIVRFSLTLNLLNVLEYGTLFFSLWVTPINTPQNFWDMELILECCLSI